MAGPRHRSRRARAYGTGLATACITFLVVLVLKGTSPGGWATVRGVVDGAPKVEHHPAARRGPEWKVAIPYRYEVGATTYRHVEVRWVKEDQALAVALDHGSGRAVDVYHRPTRPWVSTLALPKPWSARWLVLGVLAAAALLAAALDD